MVRYETLFLTVPEFTNDEFATLESTVHKTIQETKGAMISCERWGKYRLAYPVRKNDYGIYGIVRFEVEPAHKAVILDALKTLFTIKFGDSIMRILTVSLDPKKPLAYHRPESLEETPTRDMDSFFKDNKMEGLMSKKPVSRVQELEEDEEEDIEELNGDTRNFGADKTVAAATPPSEGN